MNDHDPRSTVQRLETAYDPRLLRPAIRRELESLLARWRQAGESASFHVLFDGPPGTGKTFAAAELAKKAGLPIDRVDLTGQTMETLAALFDGARPGERILYLDGTQLLFGKRTDSQNANDRGHNQQVAYLLQRIEDFPGLVILASDLASHLDEDFARRFQAVVRFGLENGD